MSEEQAEVQIAIESRDSLGHFRLIYKLSKPTYGLRGGRTLTCTGEFDLDSSLFARMVADFADLLPPLRNGY